MRSCELDVGTRRVNTEPLRSSTFCPFPTFVADASPPRKVPLVLRSSSQISDGRAASRRCWVIVDVFVPFHTTSSVDDVSMTGGEEEEEEEVGEGAGKKGSISLTLILLRRLFLSSMTASTSLTFSSSSE